VTARYRSWTLAAVTAGFFIYGHVVLVAFGIAAFIVVTVVLALRRLARTTPGRPTSWPVTFPTLSPPATPAADRAVRPDPVARRHDAVALPVPVLCPRSLDTPLLRVAVDP
jgi:hypothetical protein